MPFRSNRRPDDFIEAEIVSSTDRDPKTSKSTQNIEILGMPKEKKEKEEESSGGGMFSRLASFFGQDEESIKKRERKKQLNTAIDKVFEGSGALGTVIGSLAKGVGGIIAGMNLFHFIIVFQSNLRIHTGILQQHNPIQLLTIFQLFTFLKYFDHPSLSLSLSLSQSQCMQPTLTWK